MVYIGQSIHYKGLLGFLAIVIMLTHGSTYAAETNPSDANPSANKTSTAVPPLTNVRVEKVYKLGTGVPQAGIGDIIVVKVKDLQSLVNHAKCLSIDDRPVLNCTEQKIVLFLEGREIKDIVPESGAPRPEDETLQFHLQRSAGSDEAWSDLFGAPPFDGYQFFYRPTAVSVGLQNGYALPSDVKKEQFELIRIYKGWFIACSIVLLIVLGLLIWFAISSELLRDVGPVPTGTTKGWRRLNKKSHKPYSLARTQMAIWFFLVVASFLFIWLVTGAFDTITGPVLGLIGIGAGTALGAAAVDVGKNQGDKNELESLEAEETTLTNDVIALDARIAAGPPAVELAQLQQERKTKQDRLNLIQRRIPQLKLALAPKVSEGFLNDILTDEANGISFHRFQMFVWTLVLGLLFIYSVWYRLSMPDFGATLLALLGISSGTYLGFKIPERQT